MNEQQAVTVYPKEDSSSFLRNPAMGWAVYIDAFEQRFPDAEHYWQLQDPNIQYASILYIRVPWSQLEPEEGHYAWLEDDNYRLLIRMALDRGLKLAFRVYVDSKDAYRQATPQFVFDAGARGYVNEKKSGHFRTPYLHDPVFQEKFKRFVQAFAAEYDRPDIVDYIDGQGLGWWGEMHNINDLWGARKKRLFEWIISLYSECFKKVLLGLQYGKGSFDYALQEWALREKGYMIRRDSFGSPIWLKPADKRRILAQWPEAPVFAENCYHTFVSRPEWYEGDGFPTLHSMMTRVVQDALELHANTLDLRNPEDAALWMQAAPDLVRSFALHCGYRFVLSRITFPRRIEEGQACKVVHTWKNTGVGKLPNDRLNWNYKYKLAFALLDLSTGQPVYETAVDAAEPSDWLQGFEYVYESLMSVSSVSAGEYHFAVSIVNMENGERPEIRLAIELESTGDNWYIVGAIAVGDDEK